jgi:hypothetical protein
MTDPTPALAIQVVVRTALEYAQALIPHLGHPGYRCDRPLERLMGKGCRACGVETLIAIADFQRSGDLPVFEAELKPHLEKGKK